MSASTRPTTGSVATGRGAALAFLVVALLAMTLPVGLQAQGGATAGPLVHVGGAVFPVTPDFATPLDIDYRVAFDVAVGGPHNFFAGGLLVHNKSIAWTPEAFVPWYALWNRAPVK